MKGALAVESAPLLPLPLPAPLEDFQELRFEQSRLLLVTYPHDTHEPDRWWFAPLLYAGACLVVALLAMFFL